MGNRGAFFGIFGIGAVALLAATGVLGGRRASNDPASGRGEDSSPARNVEFVSADTLGNSALRLLEEFFGGQLTLANVGSWDLSSMIATLPDPAASHLDWTFDSSLEALQRAFEVA